jgi:hypothetical protein
MEWNVLYKQGNTINIQPSPHKRRLKMHKFVLSIFLALALMFMATLNLHAARAPTLIASTAAPT